VNRYLIVSDLHLCDVEEHPDGWKAYKSARYVADGDLDALLRRHASDVTAGDSLTLILNGDVVDFDLVTAVPDPPPWPVSLSERRRGLDPTPAKSVFKLGLVLRHHPVAVRALAAFLAAGHRVVVVMGNHDREFHFDEVQAAFREELRSRAREAGGSFDDSLLRFEPWFFLAPGELYVEHGNQYDPYSSFKHLLSPTLEWRGREMLALPMGNLSNRYLMSRMGYFNPHATDFILDIFQYLAHWWRHYALTRRSLVFNWLVGSLVVTWQLLRTRSLRLLTARDIEAQREAVALRYGLDPGVVAELARLQKPPITTRFFRIVREFWIDRVIMAGLMTGATIALALVPIPLWIKLMVPLSSFPLAYFVYERFAHGEGVFAVEKASIGVARAVARLLPVRLVSFGHTHKPRLIPLATGVSFVDSGTWAPIMTTTAGYRLAPGYRNYVVATFGDGEPCVRLDSLTGWAEPEETK
jgi:UDP-2,3-diacylglucosamine pyrophosphatase LpxH